MQNLVPIAVGELVVEAVERNEAKRVAPRSSVAESLKQEAPTDLRGVNQKSTTKQLWCTSTVQ